MNTLPSRDLWPSDLLNRRASLERRLRVCRAAIAATNDVAISRIAYRRFLLAEVDQLTSALSVVMQELRA